MVQGRITVENATNKVKKINKAVTTKITGFTTLRTQDANEIVKLHKLPLKTLKARLQKKYGIGSNTRSKNVLLNILIKRKNENIAEERVKTKPKREKKKIARKDFEGWQLNLEGKDTVKQVYKMKSVTGARVSAPGVNSLRGLYNRITDYYDQLQPKGYLINNVTVYFRNKENNEIERRTLNYGKYMSTFEQFERWYYNLKNKPGVIAAKSEGLDEDGFFNVYDMFDITVFDRQLREVQGFGKKFKNNFFVYDNDDKGIDEEDSDDNERNNSGNNLHCGLTCLNKVLEKPMCEKCYDELKLDQVRKMIEFINVKELKIEIIGNFIKYNGKIYRDELEKFYLKEDNGKDDNFDKEDHTIYLQKMEFKDIGISIIHRNNDAKIRMIYDYDKQHYESCEEICLRDNLYVDLSGNYYEVKGKKAKLMFRSQTRNDLLEQYKLHTVKRINTEYIFIDFETVTDWDHFNVNRPYSMCYLHLSNNQDPMSFEMQIELDTLVKLEDDFAEGKRVDPTLYQYFKDKAVVLKGFDCVKQFVEYIESAQRDKVFKIVTFNGANFDNYILYNELIKINPDLVSKPLISNGQMLSFKFYNMHSMFDVRKFVIGSLKSCCESFKVKLFKKKDGFDHHVVQEIYDNGKLDHFLETSEELVEYNKFDCLSLAVLFWKLKKSMDGITGFQNIEEYMTLGQIALKKFLHDARVNKNIEDKEIFLPNFYANKKQHNKIAKDVMNGGSGDVYSDKDLKKERQEKGKGGEDCEKVNFNYAHELKMYEKYKERCKDDESSDDEIEEGDISNASDKQKIKIIEAIQRYNGNLLKYYKDIVKSRVGGRTQLFNGIQKIQGPLASIDCCSLYPYVMAVMPVFYPCGEIIECCFYKLMPANCIGWFYCDVDQSKLDVKILANKTGVENDWDCNYLYNVLISTPMIKYLEKKGAWVKPHNGIYFTDKVKSCELFKFLLDIMKLKNEEDINKKEYPEKYNPVLRELYKLILNILSGKLNQGLTLEDRDILTSMQFIEKALNNEIEDLNTITVISGRAHVSYGVSEEEAIKKSKPIYIGALIYDYSKIHMHEHVYSRVNKLENIYTDTDSSKLRGDTFTKWQKYAAKKVVPHWPEVEKYDPRFKDHKLYNPKSKVFGSFVDEYDGSKINLSYFLQRKTYLCLNTEIYKRQYENKYENEKAKEADIEKSIKFHFKGVSNENVILHEKLENASNKELSKIYNRKCYNRIKDNYLYFFDQLFETGKATVLGFSLRRISKNNKKNVGFEQIEKHQDLMYNIVTGYTQKNISIKDKKFIGQNNEDIIDEDNFD